MKRRALVLGAGGHAAIAWELGVIAGLSDAGVDVTAADVLIGTSAGAVVAAQVTSGVAIEQLFERHVDSAKQTSEPVPAVDFAQWRANLSRVRQSAANGTDFLQRVGALATDATSPAAVERRHIVAARLPVHTWPNRELLVTAVDVKTGGRRVFDQSSGAELVDEQPAARAGREQGRILGRSRLAGCWRG